MLRHHYGQGHRCYVCTNYPEAKHRSYDEKEIFRVFVYLGESCNCKKKETNSRDISTMVAKRVRVTFLSTWRATIVAVTNFLMRDTNRERKICVEQSCGLSNVFAIRTNPWRVWHCWCFRYHRLFSFSLVSCFIARIRYLSFTVLRR